MEVQLDELKIAAAILCNKKDKSKEEIAKEYWELYECLRENLKMPAAKAE